MAVGPNRLERVAADVRDADELKRLGREWPVGIPINVSHDVRFALAAGAWTAPAKRFQSHKAFVAIVPFDGQLFSNPLNVGRSHARSLTPGPAFRPPLTLMRVADK